MLSPRQVCIFGIWSQTDFFNTHVHEEKKFAFVYSDILALYKTKFSFSKKRLKILKTVFSKYVIEFFPQV
jgi:hypothetical protein